MSDTPPILPQAVDFDPNRDPEAFLKDVPAKWAVYLMADESDRPVQLLCVKNLRYSLKRRLGESQIEGPSKRVDYRQLVRKIHWRRVFSNFEADAVYLEAARQFFPQTYRGMTGFHPAWFIHVNPDANFPRFVKTIDLDIKTGMLIGPVEDKHAAARLIENVIDWFDLCRYYNVLTESPNAMPCAYKEMGKCPAPCDGSISMESYRRLVKWGADTLIAPEELIRDNKQRMQQAATELRFESAGKIKQFVESLSQIGKGPFRYVRRMRDFKYLALQRGPRDNTAKVFLITPGQIEEILGLINPPDNPGAILRIALERSESACDHLDQIHAERLSVVAHHLFEARATHGAFIPMDRIDEKAIGKGFRELQKQKVDESPAETEGVVKELQAL